MSGVICGSRFSVASSRLLSIWQLILGFVRWTFGLFVCSKRQSHKNVLSRFEFLNIPGEIRNPIYDFIIDDLPDTISVENIRRLPALALTNKQIREEFISRLFCRKFVDIPTTSSLWALESLIFDTPLRPHALDMITHIRLPDFCEIASSPTRASEVFDACNWLPNVRSLQLNLLLDPIKLPILRNPSLSPGHIVERVAEALGLDKLVKIQQLGFLSVLCVLEDCGLEIRNSEALLEELGSWIGDRLDRAESVSAVEGSVAILGDARTGLIGFGISRP
ncbi:uncharacterized protein EI97DRAFT_183003 [Westerdykella ornata]|uniref:F-box domain-containing protein n=1 Tax=Westerdykella ornata TaxID=318751 RepID=A0A6A6JX60_WESOR|nr:uncharacterized protein EI97DRAFT_183003 [Westerdykella ornata]KAF2279649.1 hypothetical protein EI97DRAFT_183003 [Westerdykella ornata]